MAVILSSIVFFLDYQQISSQRHILVEMGDVMWHGRKQKENPPIQIERWSIIRSTHVQESSEEANTSKAPTPWQFQWLPLQLWRMYSKSCFSTQEREKRGHNSIINHSCRWSSQKVHIASCFWSGPIHDDDAEICLVILLDLLLHFSRQNNHVVY